MKKLHSDHEKFLRGLFPTYPFHIRLVKFSIVQHQPNGNDCGVFAIVFAISLLFNIKPEKVRYDQSLMRFHLIQIFESNMIEHFPQDLNYSAPQKVFPLAIIQKREAVATQVRMMRQKKTEQQKVNRLQKNKEFKTMAIKVKKLMTLSSDQKNIIVRGDWLNDTHMDHFNQLLKNCSDCRPEDTWKLYFPNNIESVPENKKHIQIVKKLEELR
jgi:hypothetical protein